MGQQGGGRETTDLVPDGPDRSDSFHGIAQGVDHLESLLEIRRREHVVAREQVGSTRMRRNVFGTITRVDCS